jgi:hypothetical protein
MIIRQKPAQPMYSPTTDSVKDTLKDIDYKIEEKDQLVFQSDGYITQKVTIFGLSDEDYETLKVLTIDDAWQDYHSFFYSGTSVDSRYLYNYEFKEYENLTRTKDEKELPSGLFFNYLKQENQGDTDLRRNTYSIGESIDYNDVKNSRGEARIGDEDNLLYDKSLMKMYAGLYGPEIKSYTENYYRLYTDLMSDPMNNPQDTWLEKQSNVFVLFDPNYKKDFNPYWIESRITSPSNSSRLEELRKAITGGDLTKLLFSYIKNEDPEMVEFDRHQYPSPQEDLKTWDIIAWLNTNLQFNEDENTTYLFDKHEAGTDISNYYDFNWLKLDAKFILSNLVFDNLPTFGDILNNKVCKSSIIGYKIEKMTSEDGNVIQTFYFEGSKAKLFDTQLCYDKRYYYKVSELRAVVGVKYIYYNGLRYDDTNKTVEFDFRVKPSVKLIEKEAQLFSYRVTTPPLFSPDVIVSNETNIKNKIKFYLSDHIRNIGKHFDEFEVIRQQDEEYYNFAEQADYVNDKGLSMFSHRSATGNFEVYRIDFKPTTYRDFSDGYLGVYSNTDISLHDKELHASFVDYIKHEKIYYYMFRSLSHHQKAGKPSMVFECELVQDADEVILKHKAYDLYEEEETYDTNKAFRKFIQIQPSLKHVVFKEHYDFNVDERFIGEDTSSGNDSLWDYGKTDEYFKLRVKSKKTGKKFDLNIRFKQTKN